MSGGFLGQAFVYLAAACVAVPLAKRAGLGSVLGYLLAGVIIGPFGLHLVGQEGADVMHVAEFGVVMMLFLVGLELEPALLWRLRAPILGLGGLQVVGSAAVLGALALAFGLSFPAAVAVGLTLSMSSTAIVLQMLGEKGLMKTAAGQSSFAVLLFQDLAVIPMLALFPLLAPAGAVAAAAHGGWTDGLPGWGKTLVVLGAVAGVVALGRFAVRPALRAVAGTGLREMFTAAALVLVIGIALLMQSVGLSPALGTFLAGVVLADSEYRHELEGDIEPFKGLLLGLFFIAVGASIDFRLIAERPGTIVGLVGLVLVAKLVVLAVLGRLFKLSTDQGLLFAFALPQVGEFAFVLLAFAASLGVLGSEVTGPLVAVTALSMAVTPVLMVAYERLVAPRLAGAPGEARPADAIDEEAGVIICGFGRFGNTVGRLLRANGHPAVVLDNDGDRVELLRRMGLKVFYGDATRLDLLHAAGAHKARIIILALDSPEKNLELARLVQRHFPHLTVLARANDRPDTYEFMDLGLTHIYRDTLDTALRVGVDALRLLGMRGYAAHRAAQVFRKYDEAALAELAATRGDRAAYISLARQRIAALEELLQSDRGEFGTEQDRGWDPESIREEVRALGTLRLS